MNKTQTILPGRQSALKVLNRKLKKINADHNVKYFILTDENVLEHCLPTLIYNVSELENAEFLELPAGEACKDIAIVTEVWESLISSEADRNAVIINLGGGSVSDMGGFVAATFKRGIDYINIPTTLTAMIDASIGGKTAIDLGGAKNQIGCFRNPIITCIEPAFLETLPANELRSGEYEIMKTLLLTGHEAWHSTNVSNYSDLIPYCIDFKQSVVKADPEEHSIRKILNFGHTIGHALEAYSLGHNKPMSHGEAVGIGMLYALYLSTKKLGLETSCYKQYRSWLTKRIALPQLSLKEIEQLLDLMRHDKKRSNDGTLCVLLEAPGSPVIDVAVSDNEIRDAMLSAAKL
ncbi:MAG: 3-dehydroquinate synthase [Bacteroidales bacterium]|nr:3-dehydroquinate synthase [Bacteroidales bacterium]